MKNHSLLPAVPLFAHDPFFSIWDCGLEPTTDDPRHWCGAEKPIWGAITIDGFLMRFLGRTGRRPMKLVRENVTPLSTEYVMEEFGVRFSVKFTSPLLLDDLDILSTPISFVDFKVEFTDGKPHKVTYSLLFTDQFCSADGNVPAMRQDFFTDKGMNVGYMGQMRQKPLSGAGDHLTIDWGYLFLASSEGKVDNAPDSPHIALRYAVTTEKEDTSTLLVGYDDTASINYFGRLLPAYYARNGKTITEALEEFRERRGEILSRCEAFDRKLLKDARALGGPDYALILTAAYRQSIAAHKLVADTNGDVLFISKENDSNGCAATVDVSYPSVPLFLLYAPELVRGMCRPILKFARMPIWHYDFAPHDAGRYPELIGQVYASKRRPKMQMNGATPAPLYLYPAEFDAYDFRKQMPVEESANMLLMLAAVGQADGDFTLADENLDLLKTWCRYLLEYGEDPGEQLCTDDFAGHLARNVNLSAKAVVGIAAFALILEKLGKADEAKEYYEKARAVAKSWVKRATSKDGYTYLTFDKVGWSQKYNVVWDKLFGFGLFPDSFYEKELAFYETKLNEYGLPLDSRADYTKSDWTLWVASVAGSKEQFRKLIHPIVKFLKETPNRVPFSDWYETVTGVNVRFLARSVQGGLFMPLLMKKWQKDSFRN
ncbi:MAG: DUF4965 domain-containing protein [Lachnospiraceae bacterium]|nr:DUF4965 domain-containing protein [Lachnospiraceae bacterium]